MKEYLVHVLTYGLNFVSCIKNYVRLDPSVRVCRQPGLTYVQAQVYNWFVTISFVKLNLLDGLEII